MIKKFKKGEPVKVMEFKRGDRVRYWGAPLSPYGRRLGGKDYPGETMDKVFTVIKTDFWVESQRIFLSDLDEDPRVIDVLNKLDGGFPFKGSFDSFYFVKVKKEKR